MKIRNTIIAISLAFSANAFSLTSEQIIAMKQKNVVEVCQVASTMLPMDNPFQEWNFKSVKSGKYNGDVLICKFNGELREIKNEGVDITPKELTMTMDLVSEQTFYKISG